MTVTITKEENEKALECVLRSRGLFKKAHNKAQTH